MKSSKLLGALVTLGLAAAVATPAMALENQFSGGYTAFYDLSNYTASGDLSKKDASTQNYFVQRMRLGYTAKANEDAKLVTKFEFDYNWYGNNSYATGRGTGGALGADSVQMETKHIYIDFNVAKGLNTKIGMQPYNDSFKGIIFDADMAGVLLSHDYNNAAVSVGFFRFGDATSASTWAGIEKIGRYTHDMFALDGKYSVTKGTKIGASYYYISDNRTNGSITSPVGAPTGYTADGTPIYGSVTTTANPANDTKVHTLGLNAETTVGPLKLSGFALGQFGDYNKVDDAKGYAFNVGASMPLGAGTGRTEFIYTSGGKNGKSLYIPYSAGGSEGGGFYDAEMIMLNRDKNATTIDNAIVYNSNNNDQGLVMASVGYDYPFSAKLSGSVNAGFAWVAKDLANNDNKYLGTELNVEANYKVLPSVTLGARAGYVVLGDYFKNTAALGNTPDDPYDVKLLAKFSF